MKKPVVLISLCIFFLIFASAVSAEEMKSSDMQTPDAGRSGKLIREADIEGYHLYYHLIDMSAQMKNMQGMQHNMQKMGMGHLMVYIHDAQQKIAEAAQVGYLVIGPDGSQQKVMTMKMGDGYGADLNLSKPGEYTIKCKAVVAETKLLDEFKYKVE